MISGTEQRTVLIVEDDEATAELERRALTRSGLATHVVGGVHDALAVLERRSFGAILLDYHLPDGDPWMVVDAADSKHPRIPVVLVTAQGSERIASEAIHRGVADYVRKTDTFWEQLPEVLDRVTRVATAEVGLRRLEEFFERAHVGSAIAGHDGRFERVNLAFARMHGFTVEELIGMPITDVYAPAWRTRLSVIFQTLEQRGEYRFEAEHVRKDGCMFPVIVDATPVKDDAGNPLYVAVYVQDITEQKRAEHQLRASEEKARAILDAIPDWMFRLDSEGVCLDCKVHRSDEIYPSAERVIGRNVRDLLPPAFSDDVLGYIRKTLETRAMQQWEYQIPRPGGRKDYEARMVGCGTNEVVAIVRNITAIKEAERVTRAALREKEVLLQEVHHRVKNNLQVISSLINMQARLLEDGTSRAALAECQGRVQTIGLIHEMLYQSKSYSQVSFSDYVRSLSDQVFRATGVSPATVSLVVAIEDVALTVDKAIPCGLILNELITNALKHGFPDGRRGMIRVELTRINATRLRLAVRDNGVGIVASSGVRSSDSLGLRLVTTLAEQLDADVDMTSDGGVSFQLTFLATT